MESAEKMHEIAAKKLEQIKENELVIVETRIMPSIKGLASRGKFQLFWEHDLSAEQQKYLINPPYKFKLTYVAGERGGSGPGTFIEW